MIKHSIQHNSDAIFMKHTANPCKIFVCSKPHIHLSIVPGIIPMGIRFKNRSEINRIHSQILHMGNPFLHLLYPVLRFPVIFKGCPAKAQWINLIKYTFICPHILFLSFHVSPVRTFYSPFLRTSPTHFEFVSGAHRH